MVVAVEVKVL